MKREFIVESELDLSAVIEFDGIGGSSFKPHGELIRCKDCAFYQHRRCAAWGDDMDANGYCSHAERKTDPDPE